MTTTGVAGAWFDSAGHFRGTYVLCLRCSTVAQHGSKAEKKAMSERIEHSLMLAEAPPSQRVN